MFINKIAIASDHAGYHLKEKIKAHLESKGVEVKDFGTKGPEPVDYPDFGHQLAEAIERGEASYGISICGSGNGISITANKHQGIRAAICWSEEITRLARAHNDANICSLPARFVDHDLALKFVDIFLSTGFDEGRHEMRIKKIPLEKDDK